MPGGFPAVFWELASPPQEALPGGGSSDPPPCVLAGAAASGRVQAVSRRCEAPSRGMGASVRALRPPDRHTGQSVGCGLSCLRAPGRLWGQTGRGVGPLPLGRDHNTVQGADQTPDPQRLDSTEGVTLHPPPAACRHSVHGAPGRVDGHRAVSPGEPSSLGTIRRGCGEDSFPARLLSRLPCSEPIRGSHDTKSWETLSVRTICLRGWMQSNR